MNNRIGEQCWFCRFDYRTKSLDDWKRGTLRAWSTDHEEFESGWGPFPVGVVESGETGRCHSISVEYISFSSDSPAEKC